MQRHLFTGGYSLLEILIALSIVTLLLTIATPSIQHLLLKTRVTTQISTLQTGLYFARNEAIQRGEKVLFCKSKDHKTCGGSWRDGQIILSESGQLLRVFSSLPKEANLVWNSSGGQDNAVEWLPTGHTNGQRGTFYYCTSDPSYSQSLVLTDTGRTYKKSIKIMDYQRFCGK